MVAEQGDWRVVFARTDTDKTVAEFDCEIGRLSRYVSPKVGDLSLTIPVPNSDVGVEAQKIYGQEGKLSMYAYRGTEVWWGGFFDDASVKSDGEYPVIQASGASFEVYPNRRELREDGSISMDQTHTAKWFWDYMQRSPGGNVGVDTPTPQASGVGRATEWLRSDVETVGKVLKELSHRDNGFEWIIDVFSDDEGRRGRKLLTGYPYIGRPEYETILTYPGNVITYEITGESTEGALSFQARGKAPDPPKGVKRPENAPPIPPAMSQIFTADEWIAAGYTRTDATIERRDETDTAVLDGWAKLARTLRSGPLVLPQVVCRMEGFNQSILGSTVTLRIDDYLWPRGANGAPGYEISTRVIGYEVDPGEHGATDVVKLIFENPRDRDGAERGPN